MVQKSKQHSWKLVLWSVSTVARESEYQAACKAKASCHGEASQQHFITDKIAANDRKVCLNQVPKVD